MADQKYLPRSSLSLASYNFNSTMDVDGSEFGVQDILSGSGDLPTDINASHCLAFLDSLEFKTLAAVRASIGFLSFVCCVGVLIVIVLFKKYIFFLQRLVLYLTISATVHSFSYTIARVNYYTTRPILDTYCYFGGFINNYTAAVELISIWCITISIFSEAVLKKNTQKLEPFFVLSTYLGPCLWFWIPLWKQSYGTSGGWCGLRFLNEDCSPYRDGLQITFGMWYIPLYVSMAIIFMALLIIAIKSLRDLYMWHGRYDQNERKKKEVLQKEIKSLLWYPIIYLLLNSFSLFSQIYRAVHPRNPSILLTYLRVITAPLRGAIIAVVFVLDKETRSRLSLANCRALCREWRQGDRVEEYPTLTGVTDSYTVPYHKDYRLLDTVKSE